MKDIIVLLIILLVVFATNYFNEPTKIRIHIDSSFCDVKETQK